MEGGESVRTPSQWLVRRLLRGGEQVSPGRRERCGQLSGAVGIALNLLLAAGKLLAGLLTRSLSMTADALNNLTDAFSSVVTLVGFKVAGHKADKEHPFGHGRAEYVSGLIVSLVILLVGFELARTSVEKIITPERVAFSWLAVGVLVASILVKLWMWRFNAALGKALDSAALSATALDALSDSVATSAVLAGTLIAHFSGLSLDAWLGLGVSVFILWSGFLAARDTLDLLLGRAPSQETVDRIAATVLEIPEIVGLHGLAVHEYGPGHLFATIHAEVPSDMTLLTAHAAADRAERELRQRLGVHAVIHIDPLGNDDEPEG